MAENKKAYGYWNKEKCAEEAKKYNNRCEFQKNSRSAYDSSWRNNWLDDICLHMPNVEFYKIAAKNLKLKRNNDKEYLQKKLIRNEQLRIRQNEANKKLHKEKRKNDPNGVKKYQREYRANRLKNDYNFKLRTGISSRLNNAVRAQNTTKRNKINELIGCLIEQLRNHLKLQFKEGMTWDNWGKGDGKWHIDHIKPCASFDLTDPEQQKKCFHYTNLQPLWESDNLSKHCKINNFY